MSTTTSAISASVVTLLTVPRSWFRALISIWASLLTAERIAVSALPRVGLPLGARDEARLAERRDARWRSHQVDPAAREVGMRRRFDDGDGIFGDDIQLRRDVDD